MTDRPGVGFATEPPAPADGIVNGFDLAILLDLWSGALIAHPCPPSRLADINEDCKINGIDLALLLGEWS